MRELRKAIASDRNPDQTVKFEFLYVDSDPHAMSNKAHGWRIAGQDLHLDDSQKLLIEGARIDKMLDQLDSFPNIAPWLKPIDVFRSLAKTNIDSAQGGQRRKFGRMLIASKGRDLMAKIQGRVKVLTDSARDARVTFHICCGLAGGTGSGAVVDVVAQLRHMLSEQGKDPKDYRILIYALLPEAQPKPGWDSGNYHANGYAALAELNALNVGSFNPVDIVNDGQPLKLVDPVFNGCYVFTNENESHHIVDVSETLPNIVADFIYQKTLGTHWTGLFKSENSENGDKANETAPEDSHIAQRSKRFLAFGIKRLVVPEEEIQEFLTFNFARSATLQLMYNNWADGLGYLDEPRAVDLYSEVRKPENLAHWMLSDEHLTLSRGILPDDANNVRWKPINDFWNTVITTAKTSVQEEEKYKERLFDELKLRCERVFDEGYRAAGGVKRFYETKQKAKVDIARHICRNLEQGLFQEWKSGSRSISEVHRLLTILTELLQEKYRFAGENQLKCQAKSEETYAQIDRAVQEWNKQWALTKMVRNWSTLLTEVSGPMEQYYSLRTLAEAWGFAKKLLEELISQVTNLCIEVDRLRATFNAAVEDFQQQSASRCRADSDDNEYKQRVYNRDDVLDLNKRFLTNEARQREHAQAVRNEILTRLGSEGSGFTDMVQRLDRQDLTDLLERVSDNSVQLAHESMGNEQRRVLGVNIVQKLYEELGSDDKVNDFARDVLAQANVYMSFDRIEEDRRGPGIDNEAKHLKVAALFLPECKERPEFADRLVQAFHAQSQIENMTVIREGVRPNELTVLRVDNLFPLRFIKPLEMLHKRYESRKASSDTNSVLLHLEGEEVLQPLFVPSGQELAAQKLPDLMLAHAMHFILDRKSVSTGKTETVLQYLDADGLAEELPLQISHFLEVANITDQKALGLVSKLVTAELKKTNHEDLRREWLAKVIALINQVKDWVGGDLQDERYKAFRAALPAIKQRLGREQPA
ncbi:hypothetical protein THUN1379_24700 [Paludibacterium sp. THUN1379]|nr:hypothetical protein THUN1379_24700 [Paludibacterium sp. THUN1379]